MRHVVGPVVLIAGTVAADLLTKMAAETWLRIGRSHPVLGDFLCLTLGFNEGAAFGLRLGGAWVHITVSIVAMLLVGGVLLKSAPDDLQTRYGLAFIVGGAIGNLWDRITVGRVTDFISVGFGDLRWPTFNLADSFVVIGIGLLILAYVRQKESEHMDDVTDADITDGSDVVDPGSNA